MEELFVTTLEECCYYLLLLYFVLDLRQVTGDRSEKE
jgi:hypothetical protein